MPPTLGTKIIPIGPSTRHHLRVVAGAARQALRRQAAAIAAARSIARLHFRRRASAGALRLSSRESRSSSSSARRSRRARCADVVMIALELRARQIAQLDRQAHDAGNDVRRVRRRPRAGRRCRPAGPARAVTASRTATVSCAAASSASCRSAIGVVPAWLAKPVTTALVALDRRRCLRRRRSATPVALERAALLDVQLEIAVMRALRPTRVR